MRFSGKQFFLKNLDVLYKTHTCRGAERSASPVAGVAAAHRKACAAASGGLQGRGGLSLGSVQAEGVGRGWRRNRAPSPAVTPPRGPVLPHAWRAGVPRTPAATLPRAPGRTSSAAAGEELEPKPAIRKPGESPRASLLLGGPARASAGIRPCASEGTCLRHEGGLAARTPHGLLGRPRQGRCGAVPRLRQLPSVGCGSGSAQARAPRLEGSAQSSVFELLPDTQAVNFISDVFTILRFWKFQGDSIMSFEVGFGV